MNMQVRVKYANKTYFMLQKFFFKYKNVTRKLTLRLKNTTTFMLQKFFKYKNVTKKLTLRLKNTTTFMLQKFFKYKNVTKKLERRLKNTTTDKTLTYAPETETLTERDRKQLDIFGRKVFRRILGPVYDNEKENLEDS